MKIRELQKILSKFPDNAEIICRELTTLFIVSIKKNQLTIHDMIIGIGGSTIIVTEVFGNISITEEILTNV